MLVKISATAQMYCMALGAFITAKIVPPKCQLHQGWLI